MGLKIATVVGARPQFIKAATVSRVIRTDYADRITEVLVHTGQHCDDNMSRVFFEELDIPHPDYDLGISGGRHGSMTGRMLEAIENVLLSEHPDIVLVYGDTNTTLAGALAAVKLHLPVAHVEAGLRSFNLRMPEEINRVVTDRVSHLLFCPTSAAVDNLRAEGITAGVHHVGDVMYDAALYYQDRTRTQCNVLDRLGLDAGGFVLATCHRAENTDDPNRLREICLGLADIALMLPVVFPVHPRTGAALGKYKLKPCLTGVTLVDPLSFLETLVLEQAARAIITDSGGMQKEAFFHRVPCITMRDETEWAETISAGANRLSGASREKIVSAYFSIPDRSITQLDSPFGDGFASNQIVAILSTVIS